MNNTSQFMQLCPMPVLHLLGCSHHYRRCCRTLCDRKSALYGNTMTLLLNFPQGCHWLMSENHEKFLKCGFAEGVKWSHSHHLLIIRLLVSFVFFMYYSLCPCADNSCSQRCPGWPSNSWKGCIPGTPWGDFFTFGANAHLNSSMNWLD